jgi:geranylgeranyl reductase family protein
MKNEYDVVVVGGGPVGGHLASLVAAGGYSVLILEEHAEVGKPVHCAGIFSPKVLDLVGCEDTVTNRIKGADIFSPSARKISISAKDDKAVVVDRDRFDKAIIDKAVKKGAGLELGAKVLNSKVRGNAVETVVQRNGDKSIVISRLIIGADGVKSNVARWSGLPRPPAILPGVQKNMSNATCEDSRVKIFIGTDVAPGFFVWIVPSGKRTRVGLCTRKNTASYLERFVSSNSNAEPFLRGAITESSIAGSIPMGPVEKTYGERVMIVGDGAAQVKPTSGGGIYPGLVCAGHCANTAVEALEKNDLSERFLSRYHKKWTGDIGKELRKDWRLYRLFQSFTDEKMEEAFKLLDNPRILRLIEDKGDIDYPSKLALPIVRKEPKLLKFATKSLLDFLFG